MKQIILLGATGSIGTQTLDIIRNHADRFKLVAFSYGNNTELATEIIQEFKPSFVSTRSAEDAEKLQATFTDMGIASGDDGLVETATYKVDDEHPVLVINALMGGVGLRPTLAAIESGRDVALANKETLVMAGQIVTAKAREHGIKLMPVDSEHSALWQCLNGEDPEKISKMIITASGGSFRDLTREDLQHVTKEQALHHPNWSMGEKITIDSATMMNKGLEVIEAHYLFHLAYDDIETILHPQSIVHSMVEFTDTSIIAHLGTADMKIPIAYAMNYPDRAPIGNTSALDLAKLGRLDFKAMDFERFPCLAMAYEAGRKGATYPMVLNAANEEAVALFLAGKISFLAIEEIVRAALDEHVGVEGAGVEEILQINDAVRVGVRERWG
ncbi:MAG: 1-deoxy-D-xylulose-5-phosphate reductoisomerase [Turicibacter sp.]|nr:1-deoxy-D-xylulose-5-phosphate reductoisomerase [Turicibacter sp.]